ncbi:PmoA family protein [Microbacterium yannicii]|uniref:PmoA family protein n=1 Tax=Microbacterium yannicii TaxID=671622 RepID=A0ABP9MB92_9MICO|nr:PmoA family protein [Microbacterium yannicii]MCO5952470.1 PmoA family protein [Microbacterium yannicii]
MSALRITHELGSSVTVRDGEVELFTYVYQPTTRALESPKPYLHPIRTRRGDVVSLFRPHDHVWHKGIAWALPVVGDENFWGGPTYVHGQFYVQLPNNGVQQHEGRIELEAGERASVSHALRWITEDSRVLFTEQRGLTAEIVSDDAWALTFDTQLTNVSGASIAIGSPTTRGRENAGYGGLFWRGPRSFTDGTLVAPGAGGAGDDLRGSRHEWMGFVGRHDDIDATSLVLMLDDAANPHHPPQWFARSEEFAALNPAPFFSEEVVVDAGETVRFRHAVGIATGGADAAEPLADALRGILQPVLV